MATYKPLFMYVAPASIPQIVAHIQKYLEENPILSDTEAIAEAIQKYIEEHPEIIAVASVNGKTGNVVLTGNDININAASEVTIATQIANLAAMIAETGGDIDTINDNIEAIYTELDGTEGIKARLTAVESDINDATNGIKVRLSGIEGEVNGAGGIDSRLNTVENDLNTAQTGIKARLTDVKTDISSLQTRMTQAETDVDSLESAQTALETRLESGIVEKTGGIAQIISKNTDGTFSAMHVDANSENPWFTRYISGGSIDYKGIVTAGSGIQRTEFELFDAPNLIGLTFWTEANKYYRLLLGINGNKAIFMEYYNGSTTSRVWTGTAS